MMTNHATICEQDSYLQQPIEEALQKKDGEEPFQDLKFIKKKKKKKRKLSYYCMHQINLMMDLKRWRRKYTMDEASQVQPVFIGIVFSDGFSRLQQMLNLRFIKVRITLIHNFIKKFTAFPNAHLHPGQFAILFSHPFHLQFNQN